MAERSATRVLLVGAYERDNFSDLLFLLVTERWRTQPRSVPFNDGGYLFWAAVRHPVQVT